MTRCVQFVWKLPSALRGTQPVEPFGRTGRRTRTQNFPFSLICPVSAKTMFWMCSGVTGRIRTSAGALRLGRARAGTVRRTAAQRDIPFGPFRANGSFGEPGSEGCTKTRKLRGRPYTWGRLRVRAVKVRTCSPVWSAVGVQLTAAVAGLPYPAEKEEAAGSSVKGEPAETVKAVPSDGVGPPHDSVSFGPGDAPAAPAASASAATAARVALLR